MISEVGQGQFVLAASFEGNFKSLFVKGVQREGIVQRGQPKLLQSPVAKSEQTRVIVVGDGDFILDRFSAGTQNVEFATLLVEWLVGESILPPIQKRDVTPRQLPTLNESTRSFVKYFNFIAPPIFVVIAGVFRMMLKSVRRRKHQNIF